MKLKALELTDVWYSYSLEGQFVPALRGLNLNIFEGEMVAIQGPSGSGKSTLLYLLGCMLRPQKGVVKLFGKNVSELTDLEMAQSRNQKLGFVFQQFHLLSRATVLENILLPCHYPFESGSEVTAQDIERATSLAVKLGLGDRLDHMPNQLSGGQQQRVAIARALMRDAPLILADEPTGNLDSKTSDDILQLLTELNNDGRTVVIITHDSNVASRCERVLHICDGKIDREEVLREPKRQTIAIEPVENRPLINSANLFHLIAESAPIALQNLRRNKLRSILTMMGVVIGVASVLSMVTLGQYTKQKVLDSYATMGVNSFKFYASPNWRQSAVEQFGNQYDSLDWEQDVLPMKKILPEIIRVSPELTSHGLTATYNGRVVENEVTAVGVNSEALNITRRGLIRGSGIHDYHIKNKSSVCTIGYELAEKLFLKEDPLGEVIQVATEDSSFSCLVIGVLKNVSTGGRNSYRKPNLEVMVPFTYFKAGPFERWAKHINTLLIEVVPGADVEKVGKMVQAFFKRKYANSGEFRASNDSVMVAQMNRFLSLFTLLLGLIASLSLVVGAMGITNMMLVSVNERFREIGLRKALGASDHSVRLQFLTESLVLCLVAGLLGVILGVVAYQGLIWAGTQFIPNLKFEWIWDWTAATISIVAIGLTGFLSGLTPAIRAQKLQVIEALRSE